MSSQFQHYLVNQLNILGLLVSFTDVIFFLNRSRQDTIDGVKPRLTNILKNNFRGIFGVLIPIVFLSWQVEKGKVMVKVMWLLMFWFFLIQPVAISCTGIIPLFILPMAGIASTAQTTRCYFNDNIALFILSSMLLLLINNSGFDRRVVLSILTFGDYRQYREKRMLFKCSVAAFFLSMISNRLIVTSIILEYVTPVYMNLKSSEDEKKNPPAEPNFEEMRYIVNNAIQTSAGIGSTAIIHSAYTTIAFRAIWAESVLATGHENPDIFNYLEYSLFAFPVACVMFIVNYIYHVLLLHFVLKKSMSEDSMNTFRSQMLKYKEEIPRKITTHELLSVFFSTMLLLVLFLRWNKFLNMGWAEFNKVLSAPHSPVVKDVTVLAIFVMAMNILPNTLEFTKVFSKSRKSEFENLKPESSILFWRYVDMTTIYGYLYVLGSGMALDLAIRKSGLSNDISTYFGKNFTNLEWLLGLFVVCLITCILANMMNGLAGLVCFLPLVLSMAREPATILWQRKIYLPTLAVGMGSAFGFMSPFLHTPAYICHSIGKVPKSKMAKYSVFSVIICCVVLWFGVCFWAPFLWDPKDIGYESIAVSKVGLAAEKFNSTRI